jgi:hypothetical protein
MRPEQYRMVKAELRTNTTDTRDTARTSSASSLGTVLGPGDGDDGPRLRAVPVTADALLAEVQRLYLEHRATADRATQRRLETAIRACSDRFRAFRGWTIVSTAAPAKTGRPPAERPRYFRKAGHLPDSYGITTGV